MFLSDSDLIRNKDEILADFPELESEDIMTCLAFAAERERQIQDAA
jgi:uncharacterized protein (DUF433 family)